MQTPLTHLVRISLRTQAACIAYAMRADFQSIAKRSKANAYAKLYPVATCRALIRSRVIALCGWHTFQPPTLPHATLHHCSHCHALHSTPTDYRMGRINH